MDTEWNKLRRDLQELKLRLASMRENPAGLPGVEIEDVLAPLRGCMVEMISLRSSLEKIKSGHGK